MILGTRGSSEPAPLVRLALATALALAGCSAETRHPTQAIPTTSPAPSASKPPPRLWFAKKVGRRSISGYLEASPKQTYINYEITIKGGRAHVMVVRPDLPKRLAELTAQANGGLTAERVQRGIMGSSFPEDLKYLFRDPRGESVAVFFSGKREPIVAPLRRKPPRGQPTHT